MSRQQQSQGVVLTGYHSNAELLSQTGLCASSCPPVPDPEAAVPRWGVSSCVCIISASKM